jgi:hypothetical protein
MFVMDDDQVTRDPNSSIRGSSCLVCPGVEFETFVDMNEHVGTPQHIANTY